MIRDPKKCLLSPIPEWQIDENREGFEAGIIE
jgi:hypothetical protein